MLLAVLLLVALIGITARAASTTVGVVTIQGAINPVVADYVKRGIDQAEDNYNEACIIQLDTPGGLDTSMRLIIQDIVNARIPVVVYVSPAGARAASAGAYITISAHVAAMAPGTVIGAATPVQIGESGEVEVSDEMKNKIINDAAAYMRGLAENRGRNADWGEQAVREGVSATEQEALELNVIDLVATNLNNLLVEIDGRQVTMLDGREVTLSTAEAAIDDIDMSWGEGFLNAISDPNIAYLLLSLAGLGLLVEISNPGLIFPGVVGAVALLLSFYSLGVLPVNYAGVLLIALAFVLFIAEVFTTTFGLLTGGGVVSLVLGSLILFEGGFRVSPWLIALVVIVVVGFAAFVIQRVVTAHRRQATTGREELIGKRAVVKVALSPEGTVLHEGELWRAELDGGQAEPGEEVTITKYDGLKLWVTKQKTV